MPSRAMLFTILAFALALTLSALIAGGFATMVEKTTRSELRLAMEANGHGWLQVHTDGLMVSLDGSAPTEAERFRAVSLADAHVGSSRIIDNTDVARPEAATPPDFSIQMLRNGTGISLIGLVPASVNREALVNALRSAAGDAGVTDMMARADYPVPAGWDEAMNYALRVIGDLPHCKVSLTPGHVLVEAISDSVADKARIETRLTRNRPSDLKLDFRISAPRPVITPFTLHFLIDKDGARLDACSADTGKARDQILSAARGAGAKGTSSCTLGLGVPSPDWAKAASMTISALGQLGAGSVTFSDADIDLDVAPGVSRTSFDDVVGELQSNLPGLFSLKAVLEKPANEAGGEANFTATLGDKGRVELKGRVVDARQREVVETYARAQFGHDNVHQATRVDAALPGGWPQRTLAALAALARLHDGTATVTPARITIKGVSGDRQARDDIARLLTAKLGENTQMSLQVSYDKRLDEALALPTGKECVARLNAALLTGKVNFDPGSAQVSSESVGALDALAKAMENCTEFRMEVGGHTDNQGRETMNLQLSQQRAQAVINGLLERGVLIGNLIAKGYGETEPVASNDTREGREKNRRIEFTLFDETPMDAGGPATGSSDAEDGVDAQVTGEAGSTGTAPQLRETIPVETPDQETPKPRLRPSDPGQG